MATVNNPIDTPQQREHELLALELFNSPELQKIYAQVRFYWLNLAKPSSDMRSCFDTAFNEVMFSAVVWALNQDPLYPKVITISRLSHDLYDQRIPGSRWGIDNPDSVYRVIPVNGSEAYVINGRVHEKRLVENYFTLWDKDMRTVGLLNGKDLVVDAEGRFEITVDNRPAGERPNHVQTDDSAFEFYIRDVIFDWADDRVNALRVERLGPPPTRAQFGRDQLIELAGQYMHKYATNTHRWNNQALQKEPNDFSFLIDREDDGAQVGQIYIMGHFRLPDSKHAIVLEVDMGGAEYFIAPITNIWGTTNNITERNGCLNSAQSIKNADGSYTFVISMTDPEVHNWLDPDDMYEGILTLRWAEFVDGNPSNSLGVSSSVVNLAEYQATLPDSKKISLEQRQRISKERAASYAWRLTGEI
ncbi:MAG: hypothetical protein P8J79_04020 [Halioglobus sp.]|nr:hypothetical protein [Halioglobus sp.]